GKALAHHGHRALVEVAKRRRLFTAGYAVVNQFSSITSLLYGDLRHAGKGLPVLLKCSGIANHKDFGIPGHSQIALNAHPPGAIRLHLEPLACGRRRHPSGPDHGLARDPLTCNYYAICIDLIHAVPEADFDAQILESLLRGLREVLCEWPENPRPHIDEHNSS